MKDLFRNQNGQIFILATIVLGLLVVGVLAIIGNSFLYRENSKYSTSALQATDLAEAGIDKAVASLNSSAGTYSGETETSLGNGSYQVSIISKDANTKMIQSTGYIPSKSNATSTKVITIQVSRGVGTAFNYGVQVGEGGLAMSNNSQVNGSIYSNGNITMSNNAKITGDAFVAGGVQPTADQSSDCTNPNCVDFIFGKNVNGQNQLDVAQSFTPSSSNILNKVSLKLKKIGNPSDLTIRILGDRSGSPDKNNIIASTTLPANLVTTQYGFVDAVFSPSPQLNQGTVYWILIDTSSNNNNFWSWSMDSAQGYNNGKGMYSPNWQASSPVWNNVNGDLGFQSFMGGVPTYINGSNGVVIGGNAHANTLQNLTITGGAYYQTSQNISAGSLHPNSPDPVDQTMPISDGNITDWKNAAQSMGVHTGDINSCPSTLTGKYVGNISLPGSCSPTVTSLIWVTGNFSMSNNDNLKLGSGYGASSGAIVVDGIVNISNDNKLQGSGTSGSYLILLSTFDSRDDPGGRAAINVTNNGNSGVFYANLGNIVISNNNNLTQITAWKITLANNVVINYDQGLAGSFFSSGSGGSFSAIKGTYQIK